MKKYVVIYHVRKDKRYVFATLVDDQELKLVDFTVTPNASPFTQQQSFYRILNELNVDENTVIGVVQSTNLSSEFEQYLALARMLLKFKLSRFQIDNVITRINYYHRYIRHRKVSEYDVNSIFNKLVKSKVITWVTPKIAIETENHSAVISIAIKRSILSLYYMLLKSKINQYHIKGDLSIKE